MFLEAHGLCSHCRAQGSAMYTCPSRDKAHLSVCHMSCPRWRTPRSKTVRQTLLQVTVWSCCNHGNRHCAKNRSRQQTLLAVARYSGGPLPASISIGTVFIAAATKACFSTSVVYYSQIYQFHMCVWEVSVYICVFGWVISLSVSHSDER
jgi:hypothetical protein